MFVIELIYKAELTAIDAAMKAHVAFLSKFYGSGHFLGSEIGVGSERRF